jgi:hypothetical protein
MKAYRTGCYKPRPALNVQIPKPNGGTRTVTVFGAADAAFSVWLFDRLSRAHAHEFSSYAFGYRRDRGAKHAVEHLEREIRRLGKGYLVEFDFESFFDNIDHEYLFRLLRDVFRIGPLDLKAIEAIIKTPRASSVADYVAGKTTIPTKGIPQGSCVSLFLANVIFWELDRELERLAVFARFADDATSACADGEQAKAGERLVRNHAERAGTPINESKEKSPGIRYFGPNPPPGVPVADALEFVGHKITPEGITIATKSIKRIRARIADKIYKPLLHFPNQGLTPPASWSQRDEDCLLLGLLRELRRYVYGPGVAERQMREALDIGRAFKPMRGFVGRYGALDRAAAPTMRELDQFMLKTLSSAYARRMRLLAAAGVRCRSVTIKDFAEGTWHTNDPEARVPSAFFAWRFSRLSGSGGQPKFGGYGDDEDDNEESGHDGSI